MKHNCNAIVHKHAPIRKERTTHGVPENIARRKALHMSSVGVLILIETNSHRAHDDGLDDVESYEWTAGYECGVLVYNCITIYLLAIRVPVCVCVSACFGIFIWYEPYAHFSFGIMLVVACGRARVCLWVCTHTQYLLEGLCVCVWFYCEVLFVLYNFHII